jgi:hypothetical protein
MPPLLKYTLQGGGVFHDEEVFFSILAYDTQPISAESKEQEFLYQADHVFGDIQGKMRFKTSFYSKLH